jgi:peptidoglycan/xylan/chitin deacetylase (PgdA/CDA1 family)
MLTAPGLTPGRSGERAAVVVNFHGVGEPVRPLHPGEASVWLTRETFEAALDVVAPRPEVRITIDDGNVSDLTIALPALLARRRTATFFLPAGLLGQRGFLDGAQARELAAAGMTVGSHGMMHRPWIGLPADALDQEVSVARDRLEQILDRPVREAACPFGAYDRRTLRTLRAAGFDRVYTSDGGVTRSDAWLQSRNTIHDTDGVPGLERIVAYRPGALGSATRALWLTVKRWR